MSSHVSAARHIYQDLEKLYRLTGIYRGNPKPLEQHVKLLESNLEKYLRSTGLASMRFSLLMAGVYFGGEVIFQSQTPETTLAYALFCESVDSILMSKDVGGEELVKWCLLIRSFFDARHKDADLASQLWKNPFPNLRVYLYSLLLEGAEDDDPSESGGDEFGDPEKKEKKKAVLRAGASWHFRDWQWSLPSGDLIADKRVLPQSDMNEMVNLKDELADASITDRAEQILSFQKDELIDLRLEFESYDQNQIEFNLLVQYFGFLTNAAHSKADEKALDLIIDSLNRFVLSIVERFQGGLLLFLLKKMEMIAKVPKHRELEARIRENLVNALSSPENLKMLADGFAEESRLQVAVQLVPYIRRESLGYLFDALLDKGDPVGLKNFLRVITKDDEQSDQLLFQLGEQRLVEAIPHLQLLEWPQKQKFFSRCLLSKSTALVRMGLRSVAFLPLKTREAIHILDRLTEGDRKIFCESFLNAPFSESWLTFLREVVTSGRWTYGSQEMMYLWVRVIFKFLGPRSFDVFEQYVSARKFVLWAKFPREREAILTLACQAKQPEIEPKLRAWAEREKNLIFQDSSLKEKLKARS